MALEPVYEGEETGVPPRLPPGTVSIAMAKQQLIGVRVETVNRHTGARVIRTTGRVGADENRVYRLIAATEGWIQSLRNNPAGTLVKKNELLASYYSKEIRSAETAYLGFLVSFEQLKNGLDPNERRKMDDSLRFNEEQLRALGMGEAQIQELSRTHRTISDITLLSPADGIVLTRNISPQQRFDKGTEFYCIADLSKVWIIADMYGDESEGLRPGAQAKVTARELTRTLSATVSANLPLVDPVSRTLRLRLEADNPGLVLRPDMFVDLEFNAEIPAGLTVPAEAVIDSGLQKIVYVETSPGVFEPRPIDTGTTYGNRVTVTRGLAEGDRVVTSGNFLIDSESHMRSTGLLTPDLKPEIKQQSTQEAISVRDPVRSTTPDRNRPRSENHVEKNHGEALGN
jgi:RND family efflux transporter MFP subunit